MLSDLVATTSELGFPALGLGVEVARDGGETAFLEAELEEHPPLDWTPDMATELLRHHGYELDGEWVEIDAPDDDDASWRVGVVFVGR